MARRKYGGWPLASFVTSYLLVPCLLGPIGFPHFSLMGFSVFAILQSCWLICGSHRLCVFSIFNCFAHHRPSCSSRLTSACTRKRPSHLSDLDQQHKSVPFTSFPSLLKHIAPITKSPLDIASPYPLLPNLIPFRRRNTCPTPSHLTNHPAPISRPPLPTCI